MSSAAIFAWRSENVLPLSTAEAQYYPHQQQPTAKGTTDQLNREELARLQSGSGYSPYYWASGSPWGWGYALAACASAIAAAISPGPCSSTSR